MKKALVTKKAKRQGSAILVCASAGLKNTFTGAIITLKALFKTLDISYKKEFLAQALEGKNAASEDKALLRIVADFGNKLTR